VEHRAVTEGQLETVGQRPGGEEEVRILDWGVGNTPVGEPQGEELQTGRPEQQVPVRLAQVVEAGDSLTELVNHINRCSEEGVELGDPGRLFSNQAVLGL
jgi:hypothetical protein